MKYRIFYDGSYDAFGGREYPWVLESPPDAEIALAGAVSVHRTWAAAAREAREDWARYKGIILAEALRRQVAISPAARRPAP